MNTHYEEPQSNEYFEDPQYSVPIDSMVPPVTEYETPVVTSPPPAHGAKEPTQPPPVYNYAAVPQSTAPEYAVLEPETHVYHYLESPEVHAATPAAGYSEIPETDKEGYQNGSTRTSQMNEYSTLEQN